MPMKRSDIRELDILIACWDFHEGVVSDPPGKELASRWPRKMVLSRMQQLVDRGLLEYGVSLGTAWVTEAGKARILELGHANGLGDTNGRNGRG